MKVQRKKLTELSDDMETETRGQACRTMRKGGEEGTKVSHSVPKSEIPEHRSQTKASTWGMLSRWRSIPRGTW